MSDLPKADAPDAERISGLPEGGMWTDAKGQGENSGSNETINTAARLSAALPKISGLAKRARVPY